MGMLFVSLIVIWLVDVLGWCHPSYSPCEWVPGSLATDGWGHTWKFKALNNQPRFQLPWSECYVAILLAIIYLINDKICILYPSQMRCLDVKISLLVCITLNEPIIMLLLLSRMNAVLWQSIPSILQSISWWERDEVTQQSITWMKATSVCRSDIEGLWAFDCNLLSPLYDIWH